MAHPEFRLKEVGDIKDWRAPILELWNSPHICIHIKSNLRTPLHLAAERGELAVLRLLIEGGAELDPRDEMDRTPLHFASEHGDPEILRFLIDHGANPDAQSKDQETPLFLASRKGKLEAARLLLERGADINSQDSLRRAPLHVAAGNGHYDIVCLLLDHGADASAQGRSLRTPLHLAADRGELAVSQLLIERGAELDPRDATDRTPLHIAADQGMLKVAELLLECGAEVDAREEMDWTPLHFAAQQGHLELVRLLLEHHAEVLALNCEDHTFLDVAWESEHKEIVDVNTRYEGGQTALHIAAQHGDTELMSWLIHRELDSIDPNVEDEDQETPLFPASRNGKLDATQLLLDERAEVNHRDWQKMTPLHGVSENGHDAVAQLLLERNAEVNAKHKNSWTPLHLASRAGQGNVAKALLDKDAMENAKNDSNWTPLHMASQERHLNVVRLLLSHGADVNIQNEAGETALHLAVYYAHLDVAHVLLDNGAILKIKNKKGENSRTLKSKRGKTLSELASERGDDNLAKLTAMVGDPELDEIPVARLVGSRPTGASPTAILAAVPRDVTSNATLSHPLEGSGQQDSDIVAPRAEPGTSQILSASYTHAPTPTLAPIPTSLPSTPSESYHAAVASLSSPSHFPPPSISSSIPVPHPTRSAMLLRLRPRGLVNTGNMCFVNAVLQLLVNSPPFWNLFRELGDMKGQRGAEFPETGGGATPLVDATVRFFKGFMVEESPSTQQRSQPTAGRTPRVDEEKKDDNIQALDSFEPTYFYDAMKEKRPLKPLLVRSHAHVTASRY